MELEAEAQGWFNIQKNQLTNLGDQFQIYEDSAPAPKPSSGGGPSGLPHDDGRPPTPGTCLQRMKHRKVKAELQRPTTYSRQTRPDHRREADIAREVLYPAVWRRRGALTLCGGLFKIPELQSNEENTRQAQAGDSLQDPWPGHLFRLSRLWNTRKDWQTITDQRRHNSLVPWTGSRNRKKSLITKNLCNGSKSGAQLVQFFHINKG